MKETNFSVDKGEFVAIIGPSGSGKSTLLTIAGGLQSPSSGEIWINGQTLSEKKEKARAKVRFEEIGFILQASNLVPFLTVKKQLELVDKVTKGKNNKSGLDLLSRLGLDKLIDKYPYIHFLTKFVFIIHPITLLLDSIYQKSEIGRASCRERV